MDTNAKGGKRLLFLWYSGAFLLFFGVAALFHIINGSSFIYGVDAFRQDYPAFLYLGKVLRHFFSTGNFRLYDFSIGLGDNVISPLNHNGFGDPLNLLAVFAVGRGAVLLYEFTLILRWYLCGAAMLLFCQKHGKAADISVLAAILYAFSTFVLPYGLQFYQMLNAAYLFPLLLIQLEELIGRREGQRGGGVKLSLLIALQACCSFYFLYIQTILIFVYALVEYFIRYPKDVRGIWEKVFCVLKYYLLGILLSGAILLPVLGGFFQSARVETGIIDNLQLFWTAEELLLKLENLFVHKRSAMYAVSLGISFVSFLAVIRCLIGRNGRERIFSVLLTVAYVSPVMWSMMNGFSYPDHRWVYALYFGIAYATILLIEHCEEGIGRKSIVAAAAVFICSMCYHFFVERDKIRTAVILLLAAAGIWCFLSNMGKRRKNLTVLLFAVVLFNLIFLEGPYQICGQELCLSFSSRAEMEALAETVEEIQLQPADEWYRVERSETANLGAMLQGYHGCYGYYSIMNASIWAFYDALKLSPAMQTINIVGGLDNRLVIESLLSVKYYEEDGVIKENTYCLPQGVEFTSAIGEEAFLQLSPVERQEALTKGVVLEKPEEGALLSAESAVEGAVTALDCEIEYKNAEKENNLCRTGENAELIVHVKDDLSLYDREEGELYLYMEGIEVEPTGESGGIQIADKTLSIHNAADVYTTGQRDQLIKIEEAGQDIVLELADDTVYRLDRVSVYWYDLTAAKESLNERKRHALTDLRYTDNCLEGDIDAAGGYLFLSIPYDKAWKAYIDQEEVPTERANAGFMAVKLPEGKHHVRMVYESLWMKLGLLSTILGCLGIGLDVILRNHKKR